MSTNIENYAFGAVAVLVAALLPIFGRRYFRNLATLFPAPGTPPYFSPVDCFDRVECYVQVPPGAETSGGTGNRVEVGEAGFRLTGARYLTGGTRLWVPWERVTECEPVDAVTRDADGRRPGTKVSLAASEGLFLIADPAGDRVLGYWRLYRRRSRAPAG